MDIQSLPHDVIQYIKSFLMIVSWRAELHYFKLLQRYRSFQYEHVPLNFKSVSENANYYLYDYYGVAARAYKWDTDAIDKMKRYYVKHYTLPLSGYLIQYRLHTIKRIWCLTSSFQLFGCNITGQMSPYMYKYYLTIRAKQEGFNTYLHDRVNLGEWQGCLPLTSYIKACVHDQLPAIE